MSILKRLIRAVFALFGVHAPSGAPRGGHLPPPRGHDDIPVWLSDGGRYEEAR